MRLISCSQAAKLMRVSKRRVLLLTKAKVLTQDSEGYYDLEQVMAHAKRGHSVGQDIEVKVQKARNNYG